MLCGGLVCISLSLVSTFLVTTVLQRREPVEPVVSREERLELQKDVEAAEVLAAVAALLYMSYLWRTLITASAAEPQPTLQDYKEEKQHEEGPLRRPSEHKETQYQSPEEVQYVTSETQTSDCLLPVGWTSSESQFSDSSSSLMAPPSDTQMDTGSSGTIQQAIPEAQTDHTPTSPAQELLKNETTLDCVVEEVLELQACKASGGVRENQPNTKVPLPVESPRSEASEITTSPPATDAQLYAKAQFPPSAGDFDTPPNSASDVSSPEADIGLIVIREPAAHSPQTFTVSLASDQSPRRSTPSPRSPERSSSLPTRKEGSSCRGRRRLTCRNCRDQAGGPGNAEAAATATVRVTALACSATARGGGDAPQAQGRVAMRQPAAGRGCRQTGKNQQPAGQTYASLHCRPGAHSPRTQSTCANKPPFM